MTAAERKRVVEAFSQRIRAQGFLRLQQVPKVFEEEKVMSAEEALEFGLVDQIITARK